MLNIEIPGREPLALRHLVLDYNGTIAVDGKLLPELAAPLGELSRTPTAVMSMSGEKTSSRTREPAMSIARFIKALPRLSRGMRRRLIMGRPLRESNWGRAGIYSA